MYGFQLPKDLVLKLTGKHISWEAIGIWLRLHFPWKTCEANSAYLLIKLNNT